MSSPSHSLPGERPSITQPVSSKGQGQFSHSADLTVNFPTCHWQQGIGRGFPLIYPHLHVSDEGQEQILHTYFQGQLTRLPPPSMVSSIALSRGGAGCTLFSVAAGEGAGQFSCLPKVVRGGSVGGKGHFPLTHITTLQTRGCVGNQFFHLQALRAGLPAPPLTTEPAWSSCCPDEERSHSLQHCTPYCFSL